MALQFVNMAYLDNHQLKFDLNILQKLKRTAGVKLNSKKIPVTEHHLGSSIFSFTRIFFSEILKSIKNFFIGQKF